MIILLEPLEKATTYLSSASYPTIADIRFYFTELLKHFDYFMEKEDFSQNEVASSLYQKLEEYWIILHENSIIPTLLDPGTKLSLFESGRETSLAVSKMKDQINTYKTTSPEQPTITTQNTTKEYFRQLKRHRIGITNSLLINQLYQTVNLNAIWLWNVMKIYHLYYGGKIIVWSFPF